MKTTFSLLAATCAVSLALLTAPVHAAKKAKVDICHFSTGQGIFKKLSVNGNATSAHMGHGDQYPNTPAENGNPTLDEDCLIILDPPKVLARAYIDTDGDGQYTGTTDIEIAELLDTNDDNTASAGDTIQLSQYPLTRDPCPTGPSSCTVGFFANDPMTVSAIVASSAVDIKVLTTAGDEITWLSSAAAMEFTISSAGVFQVQINDRTSAGDGEFISVATGGSAGASDAVLLLDTLTNEAGLSYYIKVQINPSM